MPDKKDLKHELSQFTDLKNEIKMLDDQLQRDLIERDKINGNVKSDSVQGSMPDFPYILHSITVKGLSDDEISQKQDIKMDIAAIREKLKIRKADCIKQYRRLLDFISNVDDSQMRQILTLKYVYGKSFQQIAFAIGKSDEQIPRKKHDKFLEKYEKYEKYE
jgi:hypothetical protein